jgi:hypothetical protein
MEKYRVEDTLRINKQKTCESDWVFRIVDLQHLSNNSNERYNVLFLQLPGYNSVDRDESLIGERNKCIPFPLGMT